MRSGARHVFLGDDSIDARNASEFADARSFLLALGRSMQARGVILSFDNGSEGGKPVLYVRYSDNSRDTIRPTGMLDDARSDRGVGLGSEVAAANSVIAAWRRVPYSTTPGTTSDFVDMSKVIVTPSTLFWNASQQQSPPGNPIDVLKSSAPKDAPIGGGSEGSPPWVEDLPSWLPHGPPSNLADALKWLLLILGAGLTIYTIDFVTKD